MRLVGLAVVLATLGGCFSTQEGTQDSDGCPDIPFGTNLLASGNVQFRFLALRQTIVGGRPLVELPMEFTVVQPNSTNRVNVELSGTDYGGAVSQGFDAELGNQTSQFIFDFEHETVLFVQLLDVLGEIHGSDGSVRPWEEELEDHCFTLRAPQRPPITYTSVTTGAQRA